MTTHRNPRPRFSYPDHLAALASRAQEADVAYQLALELRYGPRAYEMRRRPMDQTRPIRALGEAMQQAADAWYAGHVEHMRRPINTETEETVTHG